MKKKYASIYLIIILVLMVKTTVFAQNTSELKINPLMLVSLKECLNITKTLGDEFYPDWDFKKTPVLFYKPNIQELLINYPNTPKGFSKYTGFNPLGEQTIYVRNDTTIFSIDDQNTSNEIDGIPVLVVADTFSRMRSQIKGTVLYYPKEFIADWLEKWKFLPSPYDEIMIILHEGFHVFQHRMAPEKSPDERVVSIYPVLDPVNNSLYALEGNILRDAIFSKDSKERKEKIKEFVAVRSFRQSKLKEKIVEYENLNEYVEGTAKYVEYKFLKLGEKVEPIKEMYYQNGFNGYRSVLSDIFKKEIEKMVKIVSVSDDRFSNKYSAGPMKYSSYYLGACQALLLDEIMPEWKKKIFDKDVYLCDLLKTAAKLSKADREKYLQQAKLEYKYSQIYKEKLKFKQEGKIRTQKMIDSILKTSNTLLTISYKGYTDNIGIGCTSFGVTPINDHSSIYDMVPIRVSFKEGVLLQFKKVVPVIIDKEKKEINFAVSSPVFMGNEPVINLDTDEFSLLNAKIEYIKKGNHIIIQLK